MDVAAQKAKVPLLYKWAGIFSFVLLGVKALDFLVWRIEIPFFSAITTALSFTSIALALAITVLALILMFMLAPAKRWLIFGLCAASLLIPGIASVFLVSLALWSPDVYFIVSAVSLNLWGLLLLIAGYISGILQPTYARVVLASGIVRFTFIVISSFFTDYVAQHDTGQTFSILWLIGIYSDSIAGIASAVLLIALGLGLLREGELVIPEEVVLHT